MDDVKIGKYISYLLRHHPEDGNLTLDEHGWTDTEDLLKAVRHQYGKFTKEDLDRIVANNNKKRYAYNEDESQIRASQGHSIEVDVEMEEVDPPEFLYHGTGEKSVESILKEGLKPMQRLYVHLSGDVTTAINVGKRHGKPVVFTVAAGKMKEDGYHFYRSANGVYQVKDVPVEYLSME